MKIAPVVVSALLMGTGLSGCVIGGPGQVEPQESLPRAGVVEKTPSRRTSLVVRTETYLDYNLGDSDAGPVYHHTGYTLYDAGGRRVRYVKNWIGNSDTTPEEVVLDPGKYLVLLEHPWDRAPLFWVTIEDERRTSVDVEKLPPAPR